MQISVADLSDSALKKIVEEFILREGTDYGAMEYSLDKKVAQIMAQLKRGDIILTFDEKSETVNIVPR